MSQGINIVVESLTDEWLSLSTRFLLLVIKTCQVFLSIANTTAVVNTCSNSTGDRNHSMAKMQNFFLPSFLPSFLLSCKKVYFMITLLYDKVLEEF